MVPREFAMLGFRASVPVTWSLSPILICGREGDLLQHSNEVQKDTKIPYNVTTQRYLEILCPFFQSFIHTRTGLQSSPGIPGGGFQGCPRARKPTGAPVPYSERNIRAHATHILPRRP